MAIAIRPANTHDLPKIVSIHDSAYPPDAYRLTTSVLDHQFHSVPVRFRPLRALAETNGTVTGFYLARVLLDFDHPGKLFMNLAVHPEYQGQGTGTALFQHLLKTLRSRDALLVRTVCREDMESGVRFLTANGFREEDRSFESLLDLAAFDPGPFLGRLERMADQGVRIRCLDDLGPPEVWEPAYHRLVVGLEEDMPSPETYTPPSLEDMRRVWFKGPHFLPQATFVAEIEDRLVGTNNLELDLTDSTRIMTGLTGVEGKHRRRGIAAALKLTGIVHAKGAGYHTLQASNDATNRAMLSLNAKLGFRRLPPWIGLVRFLST